jgi:hypothetical protein
VLAQRHMRPGFAKMLARSPHACPAGVQALDPPRGSRRPPAYKRRRLEQLPRSAQAEVLLGMVGDGQAHVAAAHAVAVAHVRDLGSSALPAMVAFASTGGGGSSPQNVERDLHRWLRNLGGYNLHTDTVAMDVLLEDRMSPRTVAVPVLAPHTVIGGILKAGGLQTAVSLTGPGGVDGLRKWWDQAMSQPWVQPLLPLLPEPAHLGTCIPLVFHEDGAEMHRNAEYYIWSWRSGSRELRLRGAARESASCDGPSTQLFHAREITACLDRPRMPFRRSDGKQPEMTRASSSGVSIGPACPSAGLTASSRK